MIDFLSIIAVVVACVSPICLSIAIVYYLEYRRIGREFEKEYRRREEEYRIENQLRVEREVREANQREERLITQLISLNVEPEFFREYSVENGHIRVDISPWKPNSRCAKCNQLFFGDKCNCEKPNERNKGGDNNSGTT